jgi:hypothetical protein
MGSRTDTDTGGVTVLRYSAASFAGRVVNPRLAQLQNDGNVIFGLGPALMEQVHFDGGQPTNPNLADYAIPSIRDLPGELVSTCIESGEGEMHGIGEMTLPPVAPAIANVIQDAHPAGGAARSPGAGRGKRRLRRGYVRRLHGAGGRRAGQRLFDAGRAGGRERDHHGRGAGTG